MYKWQDTWNGYGFLDLKKNGSHLELDTYEIYHTLNPKMYNYLVYSGVHGKVVAF